MRVLVAISILAFLALLWAFIAIFRHVRRVRRRRRRALEASYFSASLSQPAPVLAPPAAPPAVPEITFNDPEAPPAEVSFTDPHAPIRELAPHPPHQPYLRQPEQRTPTPPAPEPNPAPELTARPERTTPSPIPQPLPRDPALSPLPAWPHFGFTPTSPAAQAETARQDFDDLHEPTQVPPPPPEPIPYAAPPSSESSTSVTPARGPLQIPPPAPAIRPVYPSARHQEPEAAPPPPLPPRPGQQPLRRADWAYFNKDMGDLSDPAPAGSRPRVRTNDSD